MQIYNILFKKKVFDDLFLSFITDRLEICFNSNEGMMKQTMQSIVGG